MTKHQESTVQVVERHPGPWLGPDAELARACAVAAIKDYGTDDPCTHQRILKDGVWNDHVAVQAALTAIYQMRKASALRPASDYHEDMGPVLWWFVKDGRIQEEPWVGHPNVLGQEVVVKMPTKAGRCVAYVHGDMSPNAMPEKTIRHPGATFFVGGWPGYHTHFTPLPPMPSLPNETPTPPAT